MNHQPVTHQTGLKCHPSARSVPPPPLSHFVGEGREARARLLSERDLPPLPRQRERAGERVAAMGIVPIASTLSPAPLPLRGRGERKQGPVCYPKGMCPLSRASGRAGVSRVFLPNGTRTMDRRNSDRCRGRGRGARAEAGFREALPRAAGATAPYLARAMAPPLPAAGPPAFRSRRAHRQTAELPRLEAVVLGEGVDTRAA